MNPKNRQEDPHLNLMTRKCAKSNFHWTSLVGTGAFLVYQCKTKLIFLYFGSYLL